jgi:tripartite-type tricarboxylate transporter receptor subunit TctC
MTAFARLAAAVLLAGAAAATWAQYPSRPVRLIVTTAPGGAPDVAARVLADRLAPALGRPVVVENRTGSNGNIGAELVARSAPDGHTLLLGQDSIFVINPHLYERMPVDVRHDLVAVAPVASNLFVLAVSPALPVRTLPEFVEHARRARPPLAYASGGNGSQHHLMMEELKRLAGLELVHVPYKGGAPATTAAVAGEVAAVFAGSSAAPLLRSGKLRALAVTSGTRADAFPGLPAVAEYYPGFEMTIWLGLFAPTGTPDAVVERLRDETGRILAAPETRERFAGAGGLQPLVATPAEFAAIIARDDAKFREVVKLTGARLD